MHTVKGAPGVENLGAVVRSLAGEALMVKVPQVPPTHCPNCSTSLYENTPLDVRAGLLRAIEMHVSPKPTATRALGLKLLQAPDPLTLEDAELELLQAAVKANGCGFRDCALAVLLEYLDSAETVSPAAAVETD